MYSKMSERVKPSNPASRLAAGAPPRRRRVHQPPVARRAVLRIDVLEDVREVEAVESILTMCGGGLLDRTFEEGQPVDPLLGRGELLRPQVAGEGGREIAGQDRLDIGVGVRRQEGQGVARAGQDALGN